MVLFALCVEPLLRKIQKVLSEHDVLGAFADDIGAVIRDMTATVPSLATLFDQFAFVSHLLLNFSKCVVIPLGKETVDFARLLAARIPQWSNFQCQDHGEYLGYMLGPGSQPLLWSKVCKKAVETAVRWHNVHAGFFYNILAFNVYIHSLFGYLLTLGTLHDYARAAHGKSARTLFSGPVSWMPVEQLCNLKNLGSKIQIHSIDATAMAAKVRFALRMDSSMKPLADDLCVQIFTFNAANGPQHPHYHWHLNAYLQNATVALDRFAKAGGLKDPAIKKILDESVHGKSLQKHISSFCRECILKAPQHAECFLRRRLDRWKLRSEGVQPAHAAHRAMLRLQTLERIASPKESSCYLKTLLNA